LDAGSSVSESDIIEKERGFDDRSRGFARRLADRWAPVAATATTAAEAMTSPAVVADAWISDYGAAWLMSEPDVNRLRWSTGASSWA
jgi:hypothetical protein